MRRFYLPPDTVIDQTLTMTGPDVRHMATVLRLRPGAQVEFFDDHGNVHVAVIEDISSARLEATIVQSLKGDPASAFPLTLIQSILKGKKMELVLQKATELGVERFIAVTSRYCENRGDRDRQYQRQHRIMLEACKQCRRTRPMQILPVTPIAEVDFSSFTHKFLALENEHQQTFPIDIHRQPGSICLIIGPEGGWHPDEVKWFIENGFTTVSLGATILRAETAAISAVSILRYLTSFVVPDAPSGHQ